MPDTEAVSLLAGAILESSSAMRGLLEAGCAAYEGAAREVVREIDLPDTDVVLGDRTSGSTVARKAVEPMPMRPADAAEIYTGLVAHQILATLDACFRGISSEAADAISVNGHVQAREAF